MADKIFINYRRDDSIGMAGRLHDRLAQVFGPDNIFMDVDNIPVGEDFVAHLNSQVTACDIVVAVIGRTWLKAKDKRGQLRLHQPDDWVAIELAAALTRNIRVIPILVDGARMPRESELPESLRPLARRQAAEVRHAHFGKDAEALIGRMRELIARQKEEQKQAEAETRQQADEEAQRLEAKRRGEEEAQRRQLEALAREVEAKRLADEEANRKRAEVEAKRRAEEEARRRLEMEARRRAEEERWKPAEIKRRAEQGQAVAIKPHKVWDWLLATRADRWFLALAVLLLIGWSGYGFFRHAVERGEQQAALKWDQERTAAMADANRKVEEAEQQRIAAVQAVERERQARESSEAKQKAEAERQRLAPESSQTNPDSVPVR